jgi:formylglycine-generating enzyme required for sulfatase activity
MDEKDSEWLASEAEGKRGKFKTKGFWLGKYTVTQAQWKAVMGNNPCEFDGKKNNKAKGLATDRFPVESVSWDDCQKFLESVNKRPDGAKVFGGMGKFVFPHEDEWEYACRGGKGNNRAFYWGNELNGTQANCRGQFPFGTDKEGPHLDRSTEVGSYAKDWPHPWGLCDMHGNISQLCDNKCKQTEDTRVARGGSWSHNPAGCRAAMRNERGSDTRFDSLGFRVAFRLD